MVKKRKTTLITVTRWRSKKTGRFQKRRKGVKWQKKEVYKYRVTREGKFTTGVYIPREKRIVKKVTPRMLTTQSGNIRDTLRETNVTTQYKDAKIIDIVVTGKVGNRRIVLKQSLMTEPIRHKMSIERLAVGKIVEMLYEEGLRVQYKLEPIKWRGRRTTRAFVKSLTEMKDSKITVIIRR